MRLFSQSFSMLSFLLLPSQMTTTTSNQSTKSTDSNFITIFVSSVVCARTSFTLCSFPCSSFGVNSIFVSFEWCVNKSNLLTTCWVCCMCVSIQIWRRHTVIRQIGFVQFRIYDYRRLNAALIELFWVASRWANERARSTNHLNRKQFIDHKFSFDDGMPSRLFLSFVLPFVKKFLLLLLHFASLYFCLKSLVILIVVSLEIWKTATSNHFKLCVKFVFFCFWFFLSFFIHFYWPSGRFFFLYLDNNSATKADILLHASFLFPSLNLDKNHNGGLAFNFVIFFSVSFTPLLNIFQSIKNVFSSFFSESCTVSHRR